MAKHFAHQHFIRTLMLTAIILAPCTVNAQMPLSADASLYLWLSADKGVITNTDGFVSVWQDQSPEKNNAVQTSAEKSPVRVAAAINGQPVVHFDGEDDSLVTAKPMLLTKNCTVFIVALNTKQSATGSAHKAIFAGAQNVYKATATSYGFGYSRLSDTFIIRTGDGSKETGLAIPDPANDTFELISVSIENASCRVFRDGKAAGTSDTGRTSGFQAETYVIGDQYGSELRQYTGAIAEIVVFNRALLDTERSSIEQYLTKKYLSGERKIDLAVFPKRKVWSPTGWFVQAAADPNTAPVDANWNSVRVLNTARAIIGRGGLGKLPSGVKSADDIDAVWYKKTYDIPGDWKDRSVWIRFTMIEGQAALFVNGRKVREMLRGDWETDITSYVTPGTQAEVQLYCTRNFNGLTATIEDDELMRQALTHAKRTKMESLGLTYDAVLFPRGRTAWLSDAFVESKVREKKIVLAVTAGGDHARDGNISGVIRSITEPSQKPVSFGPFAVTADENTYEIDFSGTPWYLDAPHLYRIETELRVGGKAVQAMSNTFGFREVSIAGNKVYLNGRRSTWRMIGPFHGGGTCSTTAMSTNSVFLDLFRSMGFNVIQLQPNGSFWWGYLTSQWHNLTTYNLHDDNFLDLCDRLGIGVTLPIPPSGNNQRLAFKLDKGSKGYEQYRREMLAYIKRYRHHPCIQAYTIGMNIINYDTYAENLSPRGMGQEFPVGKERAHEAVSIAAGIDIVHEIDPTVPVYVHAGGSWGGDISGGNQHMNLLPISEYEKWPSYWAENGKKPWVGDEFGCPWLGDFMFKKYSKAGWGLEDKDPVIAFTEFCALLYGDEAYRNEPEHYRRRPTEGLGDYEKYGTTYLTAPMRYSRIPAYENFLSDYYSRIAKSWRTWGIQGWVPWLMELTVNWQNPVITDVFVQRYAAVMQPLLVYIGGSPDFINRDRNYFQNETITKQIVIVYDGPESRIEFPVRWQASWDDGGVIASGTETVKIDAGGIQFKPIVLKATTTAKKRYATIKITTLYDKQKFGLQDEFHFGIWPEIKKTPIIAASLYDPIGDSSKWLDRYVKAENDQNLIIIGRGSLSNAVRLPFSADDINRGRTIIMFEQTPDDLLRLGLRCEERGVRKVFVREKAHPVMAGIQSSDLEDWRGSASLLPEETPPRYWTHRDVPQAGFRAQRMTRCGNHGNVASAIIEIPHKGNFRPLIDCEFDMAYSPLLEWRHGKGRIIYCQLDLTGRVGVDPAATAVAEQLLKYAAAPSDDVNRTLSIGMDESVMREFASLGFEQGKGEQAVRIMPPKKFDDTAREKIKSGYTALIAADGTPSAGYTLVTNVTRSPSLDDAVIGAGTIGPGLLRWRQPIDYFVDANGSLVSDSVLGKGRVVFCGVPVTAFDIGNPSQARLSQLRVRGLYNRMLSFLNVKSEAALVERITTLIDVPSNQSDDTRIVEDQLLNDIEISAVKKGPLSQKALLDEKLSEESVSWKSLTLLAAASDLAGYGGAKSSIIDVASLYKIQPGMDQVVLIRGSFDLAADSRVNFYAGGDYWAYIWVDGTLTIDLSKQSGAPGKATEIKSGNFTKGKHTVLIKLVSGSRGFNVSFFMDNLAAPRKFSGTKAIDFSKYYSQPMRHYDPPGTYPLYLRPMEDFEDPYLYFAW
ncbi:MAG: LamG-like jellyroll fold domain-containing protein [Spirochaetota bacterium]